METYQYKCKDCGSKKYIKNGDEYICEYCGSRQVVNFNKTDEKKDGQFPMIAAAEKTDEGSANVEPQTDDEKGLISAVLRVIFNRYLVRLLLTIFFGLFGVHKFADGKFGMGILYLFTCGLFFVGYLIDVVSYAAMYISEIINRIRNL